MNPNDSPPPSDGIGPGTSGDPISKRFGEKLRDLRKERDLTQEQMAATFGIDRSFISDVERGVRTMSLTTLEIVAIGMNISLSELLENI